MQPTYLSTREVLAYWLGRSVKTRAIQEVYELNAAIGTDQGPRDENQDRAVIVRNQGGAIGQQFVLVALADGIGGLKHGSEAACLTLAEVASVLTAEDLRNARRAIIAAIQKANNLVFEAFGGDGGATLIGCLFSRGAAIGFSAGDSRLFAETKAGHLDLISIDDTIAGELQRLRGNLPADTLLHPMYGNLAQYVGLGPGLQCRIYEIPLENYTSLTLTSDGAHFVRQDVMELILRHAESASNTVTRLVQMAKWLGVSDNATALQLRLPLPNMSPSPYAGLEIWDSFSRLEILFSETWPQLPSTSRRTNEPPSGQPSETKVQGRKPKHKAERKNRQADSAQIERPNRGLADRQLEIEVRPVDAARQLELSINPGRREEDEGFEQIRDAKDSNDTLELDVDNRRGSEE